MLRSAYTAPLLVIQRFLMCNAHKTARALLNAAQTVVTAVACIFPLCADADESKAVDYLTQVKPLLSEKCYSCHGSLRQESGLRLDTRSLMIDAKVIVPSLPGNSELLRRVLTADGDERMPPAKEGSALKPDEIELLQRWIAQGAVAPQEAVPRSPLEHWAFQRITKPAIPRTEASQNPIDAFLDDRRDELSLRVQPPANRGILVRRLYLDLVGLPPSLEQLHDERPWEQIVDELLLSPQHGERWGRHWMDIWRYSDWYGLGAQLRYSQKHIWHWRDWVIESINRDKGYDQMIREMLAADEIAPLDQNALRATGFLARNYYLFNRTTWLDSTIEHTGKAFLGLTLNCAKCHDHKYDPVTHLDYYQMRAIFEPHQVRLDPVPGVTDFEVDGLPRVFDDHPDEKTHVHLRGNPGTPDNETVVRPRVPEFLAASQAEPIPVALPYQAFAPGARNYVQRDQTLVAKLAVEEAQEKLASGEQDKRPLLESRLKLAKASLAALSATIAADNARYGSDADEQERRLLAKAAAVLQTERTVAAAQLGLVEARGEKNRESATKKLTKAREELAAAQRGEVDYVAVRGSRKALESPAHKEADYPATYSTTSTGRRTALANWIVSTENPLTARVAVNHVWARHFGEPLVESVFDFGLRAPRPANMRLLDFLAAEFMESGWSIRYLHRMMVTSKTYQLSSSSAGADESTIAGDSGNQFYWRMNGKRMESQVVRDSLLHLADELDTTIGGPSVDANGSSRRRSVYFKHSRDDQNKFLDMFDDADLFQCYRRTESIVPQQALALANSSVSMDMADKIAARLAERNGHTDRELQNYVEMAIELLLARPATEQEIAESLRYFADLSALPDSPDPRTQRARFVHALLNHNDFISIR